MDEKLKTKLSAEFDPQFLSIEDTSDDCGIKLNIIIVSR
jgi:stress-induced morphogen